MRGRRELGVLFWKEMLDLKRDRKTLFTSILLPLISLPLIGLMGLALVAEQPVHVAIIDLDRSTAYNNILNITVSSHWLAGNASKILRYMGYNVSSYPSTDVLQDPNIDVALVIPKGFAENASSLNLTARVRIIRRAGVQAAVRAESTLYGVVSDFSRNISDLKLNAITRLLKLNATIPALRNPVTARTEVISVRGKPVSREVELRNAFARILVIAFSFVVTPAAGYVIDGIIGERERKTIELLLASPTTPQRIVYAKLLAATILGLITALADILGLVVYMGSISVAAGASFGVIVDPFLLLLHSATAFFTILVTISIALPFITRTKGIRSASNIMSLVTIVALVFFFTGFFVDYIRLSPSVLYPLYIVPYTHSILVIQGYILGYPFRAALHLLVLALLSIILLYLASKTVNTEKLLTAKA